VLRFKKKIRCNAWEGRKKPDGNLCGGENGFLLMTGSQRGKKGKDGMGGQQGEGGGK